MIILIFEKGVQRMGLFINREQHYGMYKNVDRINEPNQTSFRRDHLAELLKEQQKTNESLRKSMMKLGILHEQRNDKQLNQWQEVSDRLGRLEKINHQQDLQMMEHLKTLTEENKNLQMMIEDDHISSQEMIKQQSLDNLDLTEQLTEQKESQQEVLIRLDNQEALTEKALRQIGHLRSSLFERTNYLAEKIEDSYQLTSSYLYQLLTGTDQSLTFYVNSENKKEKDSYQKENE